MYTLRNLRQTFYNDFTVLNVPQIEKDGRRAYCVLGDKLNKGDVAASLYACVIASLHDRYVMR